MLKNNPKTKLEKIIYEQLLLKKKYNSQSRILFKIS